MYSDAHLHLGEEAEEHVKKAEKAGVVLSLTSGIDLVSSRLAVKNAGRFSGVYACVGIHPWRSSEYSEAVDVELRRMCEEKKVVAISEIGLDYHGRMSSDWKFTNEYYPKDVQLKAFKQQVKLAEQFNIPFIFHVRKSEDDIIRVLEEEGPFNSGSAIHGFSGNVSLVGRLLRLGCFISIGRWTLVEENQELVEVVRAIPIDRLLTETDSADPADVVEVASKIAAIRCMTSEEVGRASTANLRKLIGLPPI